MLSFSRRAVLVSLLAVAGCGFTPAYGPNGSASVLRNTIVVESPNTRNEFTFVTHLERQLGQASTPRFALGYTLSISQDGVAITPGQEINRYNVVGKANFALRDYATGAVVTSGVVDSFTAYSVGAVDATVTPAVTNSTVSTLAAQRDAYDRLTKILADQIVARLVATSPDWRP